MTGNDPQNQSNLERRHFLGLATAATAKIALVAAAISSSSVTHAQAKSWWKTGGDHPGKGHGQPGGNGQSGGSAMCFLRGTSIATPTGEVFIEDLQIGNLVETVGGNVRAVKWIGRHFYKRSGLAWNDNVVPIRIWRHALGHNTPHQDLYLSPGHALFIGGVLIRVKDLVNGTSIAPAPHRETIEYYQIVLDSHDVILAEGVPAETFLLTSNNIEGFANFREFTRLYPGDQHRSMVPYAPIVGLDSGREHLKALLPRRVRRAFKMREPVQDIFGRIAARAGQLAG
ncbi:Hint domain-containing protein [Pararhizobium sp. DWP1-1-3]|uniref:Hint domain-containing protein n=1 Tax=Pararhizobium sp. DWP1-1-3 TaxID=2804652 RepID=UPI003CF68B0B